MLCFNGNRYQVSPDFAVAFVKMHRGSGDDDNAWRTAQQHWERVVERAFDTDAVAPDASGDVAVVQAVVAAAELLGRLAQQGRCPLCVGQAQSGPHDDAERERV
jgi:hypothetical protein